VLQVIYFFHFLEEFLLPVFLALEPLFPEYLAVGKGLTEGY
jgi:hypothetical protein